MQFLFYTCLGVCVSLRAGLSVLVIRYFTRNVVTLLDYSGLWAAFDVCVMVIKFVFCVDHVLVNGLLPISVLPPTGSYCIEPRTVRA